MCASNRNTNFTFLFLGAWRQLLQTPLRVVFSLVDLLNSGLERPIRALLSFGCQLFVKWKPTKHVGRQYWILIFGDLWFIVHDEKIQHLGNAASSRFATAVSFACNQDHHKAKDKHSWKQRSREPWSLFKYKLEPPQYFTSSGPTQRQFHQRLKLQPGRW